jgi:hypothetical protein
MPVLHGIDSRYPLAWAQVNGPRDGVVRSADGRPLEHVLVRDLNGSYGEGTNATGRFQSSEGHTFLFFAYGFRPQLRTFRAADDETIEVILERETTPVARSSFMRQGKPGSSTNFVHVFVASYVQYSKVHKAVAEGFDATPSQCRMNPCAAVRSACTC